MTRDDWFQVKRGTKEEIVERMMQELNLTAEQAEYYISFLSENMEVLSEDEAYFRYADTEREENISGFMTDSMTYYVNLSRGGIYMVLFLLNRVHSTPEGAFAKTAGTAILGGSIIINLENHPDAKCVLLEMAKHRRKGISLQELLKHYEVNGKESMPCFNNHYLNCIREDGNCCLTEERIKKIVDFFETEGAVRKNRLTGRYYYQI